MSDENEKRAMSAEEFFAQQKMNNTNNETINNNTKTNQQEPNMSGKGESYPVPDIVAKRFNWGAFFLSWIWGIGNKTYITCVVLAVTLIPLIGRISALGFCIWFGIKGNSWAWQNKRFESVEQFHSYQRKWAAAGTIFIVFCVFLGMLAAIILPQNLAKASAYQNYASRLKAVNTLNEALLMNEALEEKCELSSSGIAKCFAKRMLGDTEGNVIKAPDGVVWTFDGDGVCKNKSDCKVTIDINVGQNSDSASIHLYADSKGIIHAYEDELNEYKNAKKPEGSRY